MVPEIVTVYVPAWLVGPVMFLAVVVAFYLFATLLAKPFTARLIRRSDKSSHLAKPLSRAVMYVLVIVGLGVGLVVGGYGDIFSVMGTVLAAATVAVGFAMKDTIAALVAGLAIFFDKPFKIGDRIEWGEFEGTVTDIRLRATKVETYDNELLTVPNDKITNEVVKNLSARDQRRFDLTFGIGYEDDIENAKYLIHSTVSDVEGVLDDPDPTVHIENLGDTAVELRLRFWVATREERSVLDIKDELYKRVKDAFEKEGIDMPYPTYTLAGDSIRVEK